PPAPPGGRRNLRRAEAPLEFLECGPAHHRRRGCVRRVPRAESAAQVSGHNAATAASTAPRRTTAPSRLAPSAARVRAGVGGASIETSRGAYRELAMRIFES